MPFSRSFPASFGRSLQQRLDRLGAALSDLRERMRDAVAQAIGVAAADAVRAVTRALLSTTRTNTIADSHSWSAPARSSLWNEEDDLPSEHRFQDFHDDEGEELLDDPPQQAADRTQMRNAFAIGCEGTAWWLRRSTSKYALTSIAVGLLCMAVAYLVGNQLAGSVLMLAALADVIRSGTALLSIASS